MLIVSLLIIITLYAKFVNRKNKNLNSKEFRFLFFLLTKFAYRVIIVSKLTISILIIEVLYG